MDVVITPKGVAYKSKITWDTDKVTKTVSEAFVDHFVLTGLDPELPESTEAILEDFDSWKDQNPGYNSSHLRQSLRRLFEAKLIEEYRGR